MNIRKLLASLSLMLVASPLAAQTFTPERSGGVYFAYPVESRVEIKAPDGYVPFYISHYGRHGSRWLPSEERYDWVAAHFSKPDRLTAEGKRLARQLKKIAANARGNAGQLTPLGHSQHRAIARRMAEAFPEVVGEGARIEARSSVVGRCRASMLAFTGELSRRCPWLKINPETDSLFMSYMAYSTPEQKALEARTKRLPSVSANRLMAALFRNPGEVDQPQKLLSELHTIASDMQDIPMRVSLWSYLTEEEMLSVHDANNERMTICNGNTPLNGGIPALSAVSLWQMLERQADDFMAQGGHGATLRFGHDTNLYRLLTLLRLSLPGTGMEDIIPMAANLQMVFYRNASAEGEPLVCFLHNERPQRLTEVEPAAWSNGVAFYRWTDVKSYVSRRIHNLGHLSQLVSLNTMVGTAPANTTTAGLFGKGSEEHGQTLPAVLVPNGQNFWTPQTRATEKKCVAPFYYTDSLLQGFRASHWLVGGCTQDYGSFTIATLADSLRTEASSRATHFSHDAEISHPHYYSVVLPKEHLTTELTALSHSSILRITPDGDRMVYVVIESNSDEGQATVSVDTAAHVVFASNPVHRIYQGWGEPAGFSGHLALTYSDELAAFGADSSVVWLAFRGTSGKPVELRSATSFTSPEAALRNLHAEASGKTFEQMMEESISLWTDRLHRIDVADDDASLVRQFYGALYRASFLPREMSDCDGAYPKFADGSLVSNASSRRHYGDFSMWDTYRALHPLLTIIAPEETAEMMQSLVDMYEEGGWLPIFPCWNSYTAAMIGDHCTAVLADAYVKGIRGFDAEKALEAMSRNAFQTPATLEEYRGGMGRRALDSYMKYGYIPMEDHVPDAFHTDEQTSRTLEYAFDDFCVAQMMRLVKGDSTSADYQRLMARSENWRNVINPNTGYADGRHADGSWENNADLTHRKSYITEGATCHYTWYVPHNLGGLMACMGGEERFVEKLDSMFLSLPVGGGRSGGRYWHGNEPCHQVAWLYDYAGHPEKTSRQVAYILRTEYNDTPGGLSGNDDAGQMSAWQVFAMMGFYPVCPATASYALATPALSSVTLNLPGAHRPFVISSRPAAGQPTGAGALLDGQRLQQPFISHDQLRRGGQLTFTGW